jgi:hypothetical protein
MNPLPSNDPLPATRAVTIFTSESDFDVRFSDAAFCDFSEWVDGALAALEGKFGDYVTHRSKKRSVGR